MSMDEENVESSSEETEQEGVPEAEETAEMEEVEKETEELEEGIEEEVEGEEEEEATEEERVERERRHEEDIVEERIYTIPLSRAWISPRKKRAPRAVRILKSFIMRHMKPDSISISGEVNQRIWSRGIEKPPRKIRIRAVKDQDGKVSVYLAEAD
ncbi:MAG: 50S ribosomal protein L31e [Candidatus Bathyarchaeia archaeon]